MDIIQTQSSNEDLLCCRACLRTDCKLFNIQEYKLYEAFSRISGTLVSKDHFPQYLCTHCRTLLLKCTSFKDMCLRTEQLLERELLKGELNTDCIRRIDRSHWLLNLTLSVVNTIDSTQHPHTEDIKKEPIDINNTNEPTIETEEEEEENTNKPTIETEEEEEEDNTNEPTIETAIENEVNMEIDEDNLSETTIDEVNLSETTIDKVHLAPNTNVINLGAPNTDKAHIETVAIGKRKADSKIELMKKKDKAKIKRNVDNVVGDVFVVNKMKTVKTYKRNIATVKKKMDIEIQANSGKVNDELDKNKSNIDLDTDMSKANKKISYKSINTAYAGIINDDIGDSDIDDINEVKARMYIVNVDSILKKTVKKRKSNKDLDTAMDKANINVSYKRINTAYEDIIQEPIDINNTDEPTIETAINSEVNMEIDEDNLSETTIDELNLSETTVDEINLSETTIDEVRLAPNTNVINLGAPNTDKAHIETVVIDSGKRKADSKIKPVKKKHKAKIKGNVDNVVGDVFVVNKMKTVKTYKRNIATVKKKMNIEIQANSDKVNDELDKNKSNIDLDTDMSKANKKVSYKSINTAYAGIINDDIGDSDIDDINEVKARMYIVDVDSILKKTLKKTKTFKRKIRIPVKKNIENSKDNSDNADEKPVKQVKRRRRKERKVKYRNPENDYLPVFDFAKFESDYGVKIVVLSKQEQLEEIAARKQSANYTTAQFPCADCGKGFDMEPAFNNHRRRHSPSAGSHACEICLVRFRIACMRHRHQDLHKLKFICVECGFVSRARWTAKLHYEMHNGRQFVCKYCGKGFSKRTSYLSHVRLSHPALNVVCCACGETFVSEHGLKMHVTKMHAEIMKPQRFKCPICSASFLSSDALNRHTDSGEHAGSACEQCGESCASEEALQAHVGDRHPSDSQRCEECCATFSSSAAFETHFRRKHLNERYKPAAATAGRAARKQLARSGPRPPPPRGQFVCEQCGHVLRNAALLRYHQNGHLAVKPFPCPECPKTFATNSAKNSHARMHKGERPYKCYVCSLRFAMKANMKRHHSVVHLGVHANASCHVCARVFTSKSSLSLHISTVHNGQPWPKRERRRKVAKD